MSGVTIPMALTIDRSRGVKGYSFAICAPYKDGLPGSAVLAVAAYKPHADLFAAAPMLLVAARLGLENIENELVCSLECSCELDDDLQPIRSTLIEKARPYIEELELQIATIRAAIAKAEGRS